MRQHSITASELLHIPLLMLVAMATYQTPAAQKAVSPIYHRMNELMPLNWWLLSMGGMAVLMLLGLLFQRPSFTIVGYMLAAILWMFIAVLIYGIAHTFQTPLIYGFVGAAAIYRAADLWVQWRDPTVTP